VLIAVVDGLKGFLEAINAVFPDALVQTCIVHLIRYSMQFASWKERKQIAAALRNITAKWKNAPIQWHAAKAQVAIQFEERFVMTRG
jgi:transposase-like protein